MAQAAIPLQSLPTSGHPEDDGPSTGSYSKAANGPDSLSMEEKATSTGKHSQSLAGGGWDRSSKRMAKDRKIGHRRVDEAGQVTYKKIETSQICGAIQLGIGTAIASLASKPERDLLMQDFAMIETTNFVKEGSKTTPAHHFSDFKFKNYAPVAFRYFRDLFGIKPEDFLESFCTEPLRELSNPGASGSVFYLTYDDEFIIKTVQHKEAEFLQKLLPGYYMNLNQNPRTLLPKFFGLYCYICGGKNVRTVVMNNLLPTSIKMHEKYDLKGSTYKRKANKYEREKESPTYKDLDFMEFHPEGISLEADTYNALVKTLQRDCRVLESFKIMDYSLLVGVHNLDLAAKEKQERMKEKAEGKACSRSVDSEESCFEEEVINEDQSKGNKKTNINRSRSVKQRVTAYSTVMESIHAEAEPIDEEDDIPPGGIIARNTKGERLLLFLGVIDILQSYRLKKKVEHTLKSMFTDGDTVSVHRPSFYASRFLDFMAKRVFKKMPSRTSQPAHSLTSAVAASAGSGKIGLQPHPESGPSLRTVVIKRTASRKTPSSNQEKKTAEVSVSQVNLTTESAGSITSSSSGFSSAAGTAILKNVNWTPVHSVTSNATPTHTEGTPSLTESSESELALCPSTPQRSIGRRSRASSHFSESGIEPLQTELASDQN